MQEEKQFLFGSFRLDMTNECLWQGEKETRLTPKAFAVLLHLVNHPGRLVAKETLFETIWPKVYVTDAALTICIGEIRKALRDDPKKAEFIETVHRRGFRFIAPITTSLQPALSPDFKPRFQVSPFVGREVELRQLQEYLAKALGGQPQIVFVIGEPGIGKTRIVQELAVYAGLHQVQVLWGRCYNLGAPPYWPWIQTIRSYVRDHDNRRLRSEMRAGVAEIAEIVPDLGEKLSGLGKPRVLQTDEGRFRLFDSITAFLKRAARRQPLVLILEDLHDADKPSLLLLEFIARELGDSRILIIGNYRDVEVSRRHPLSQTLVELTRERLFQRVVLGGLSEDEVGRFIEMVAAMKPQHSLVEAVCRRTDGNPLFMTELVRLMVQEGEITSSRQATSEPQQWSFRIPEGVREAIGKRLDRLSDRCNQVLTLASVIGQEFTLEQLERLVDDLSGDRLLELLEEALAGRVIDEIPLRVGRYKFTHALVQETLVEEISTARRARLHGQIGKALEELYGDKAEGHAAELAHHFAQAEAAFGTTKLVRYSLLAGERALATYAHEEAVTHFQRALNSKEGQPMDSEKAALLFGLGRSQLMTLPREQIQEAFATLSAAFDYYAEMGDVRRAVSVGTIPFLPSVPGQRIGARQLVSRALKLVPADSHDAGRLLCNYARVLNLEEGKDKGIREALGRALTIAQREGDLTLEMRTLAESARVDWYHLRWQEALEKNLRVIELSQGLGEPYTEMAAHYYTGLGMYFIGDSERAGLHATASLVQAKRLHHRYLLASVLFTNEMLSRSKGDWRTARDFSDCGLAVAPYNSRLLRSRVMLEYELGDFGQGEAYLERLLEAVRRTPAGPSNENASLAMVIPLVVRITGMDERLNVAESAAQAILSAKSTTLRFAMWARAGLALLAVQRGNVAAAREQYLALKSARGTMMAIGMAADRLLGLLVQTMGKLDKAMGHFEDALAFCKNAHYRPEYAWTACDYADVLLQRNSPRDRKKAVPLQQEALTISRDLGMRPLKERVLAHQSILEA